MYVGLLHLHSFLRWVIIILLLLNIARLLFSANKPLLGADKKRALFLLISAHITLLIGLYQYFAGGNGFALIQNFGMATVMKNSAYRFWAVEHIFGMIVAIALITVGYSTVKKGLGNTTKSKKAGYLFLVALIIILATVPWPFRPGIGRPWFPGM
jgi:hypothetical protein